MNPPVVVDKDENKVRSSNETDIKYKSRSNNHNLVHEDGIYYQTGFGNSFESELLPDALPRGRNNPRFVPYGLYAEQLSGTAFTLPRYINRRTWLYRIQPGVTGSAHSDFVLADNLRLFGSATSTAASVDDTQQANPNPMRWKPFPFCERDSSTSFISGLKLLLSSGSPEAKSGLAIYMYSFDRSMKDEYFYNSDGDFLIVAQTGSLRIHTELGRLIIHQHEVCVIPRGMVFSVLLNDETDPPTRGYVLETYAGHFQLPELGPIGSNGLANARDFYHPTAWCISSQTDYNRSCTVFTKFGGRLWVRQAPHSPFNVVAWHGNYVPFKYNLNRFCAVNSVTYDHIDPSIYTVLTCPSPGGGEPLADFVVFPHRILATDDNTLRPPWFHRNTMSEFMGLLSGTYDAKTGEGFSPGGASWHPCMAPHGPDAESYHKAVKAGDDNQPLQPVAYRGGIAFMFETTCQMRVSEYALTHATRDTTYAKDCWSGLKDAFTGWELLRKRETDQEE
ncbi:homogentisate 1-2-dioxygenase [Fragilaria crotonensis]|nr:homogentisate 1-2-dioxygenase [Fragilaria crotonensis]